MNERIQAIAREAGFFANPDVEKFDKFAELIVRECIDYCNAYASVDGTAQKIVESIKKDFGLEE